MDRNAVRDRIKRAVTDGRITFADAEIRLRNVDSAQSDGELDLIVRDLDQLEVAIAPTPAAYPSAATDVGPSGSSRQRWPLVAAAIGVVVALAAGFGVFVLSSGSDPGSGPTTQLGDPVPIVSESPIANEEPTESAPPTAAAYELSPDGVRTFIRTYRAKFGTTKVVTATFYGDYVVVGVPAEKNRHSGWVYRPASGFTDFGGVSANFPGQATVDLARLDVAALFKNLVLAGRTLRVEDPEQRYVNIDYRPAVDQAANVNIYLTNRFGESGYLATRLNGRIERAYPFTAQ